MLTGQLAVAVGFEPTRVCALHTFEVSDPVISVGRESTIPSSQAQSGPYQAHAVRTDCNQKCNQRGWVRGLRGEAGQVSAIHLRHRRWISFRVVVEVRRTVVPLSGR
jgi:hypothetical protein